MKFLTLGTTCVYLLALSTLVWAQDDTLFADPQTSAKMSTRSSRDGRSTRSRVARLKRQVPGETATLNLFPGTALKARRVRTHASASGEGMIWSGEIAGEEGSEVTLAVRDGMITGSIRTKDGEFYTIRPQDDGSHVIDQLDPHLVPVEDEVLEPEPDLLEPDSESKQAIGRDAAVVSRDAASSTLDMMVVYTPEARLAAGGATQIRNMIDLAIAEANQSFVNSGISIVMRLVYAGESAPSSGQGAASTYLAQVTRDASLTALRNQYGADIVSVWVNGAGSTGGTVGIGWVMTSASTGFAPSAFSVVEVNFATGPNYSFTHEVGHNLGSAHDRTNSGGGGLYPYSYGYQQPNGTSAERFVTIMAYRNGCSGCPRVNYWSNPDVRYAGYAMGVPTSQSNSADNRQTLNNSRTFAEQFRTTTTTGGGTGATPPPPTTTTNAAPVVVSVSPSAGTGTDAVLTGTYSDANGAASIFEVYLSVANGVPASGACSTMLRYGQLWMRDDSGYGWIGPGTPGTTGTVQNSQCRISMSNAAVTLSGNTLTLRLPITFLGSFTGTKDIMLLAGDTSGVSSGWQKMGSWTIAASSGTTTPVSTTPSSPQVTSISPASGAGNTATFTAEIQDANGAADITTASFLVNANLTALAGCYLQVLPSSRSVYLLNNTASAWLAPGKIGTATTLSNGQCSVDLSRMTLDSNGTRLTITYPIRFTSTFAGTKALWLSATDSSGRVASWLRAGSYTVQ